MGRTKDDPMSKAVLAAFHTEQKGVVVTNWQPVRIETSDATGNNVVNNSWSNSRDENGDATMTYQWGLWPDEPAWKLRVEMSRTSGFNDDELWKVENLPVKPGSQQDMWNYGGQDGRANSAFAETNLNDIHVKVFPAEQFTDCLLYTSHSRFRTISPRSRTIYSRAGAVTSRSRTITPRS